MKKICPAPCRCCLPIFRQKTALDCLFPGHFTLAQNLIRSFLGRLFPGGQGQAFRTILTNLFARQIVTSELVASKSDAGF